MNKLVIKSCQHAEREKMNTIVKPIQIPYFAQNLQTLKILFVLYRRLCIFHE